MVKPRSCHEVELTCHVDFCREKCKSLKFFYSHLKIHIREGKTVACPYRKCDKRFRVLSTFTSHVSRRHKDGANEHLVDSVVNPGMSHECCCVAQW